MRPSVLAVLLATVLAAPVAMPAQGAPAAADEPLTPSIGTRVARLLIRGALVIDGAGNPTRGPMDILVEGSRIAAIQPSAEVEPSGSSVGTGPIRGPFDRVIEARGLYVMPGIIDLHGHTHFRRAGQPMPRDYVYKLWLAHGITTVRDPGSTEGIDTIAAHARLSVANRVNAPTLIPYAVPVADTPEEAR